MAFCRGCATGWHLRYRDPAKKALIYILSMELTCRDATSHALALLETCVRFIRWLVGMEADRLDRYGSLCSKYALPPVRMMVVFVTAPFQSSLFPVADNTQELSHHPGGESHLDIWHDRVRMSTKQGSQIFSCPLAPS